MASESEPTLRVEVAYALPERQWLKRLEVPNGCTAVEAIRLSGLPEAVPFTLDAETPVGIFSRKVAQDQVLREGDRVEVYRPLIADPKESRRRRAEGAKTGRTAD